MKYMYKNATLLMLLVSASFAMHNPAAAFDRINPDHTSVVGIRDIQPPEIIERHPVRMTQLPGTGSEDAV